MESSQKIGWWYYGKTRTGKTHAAIHEFPQAYRKCAANKWWDSYDGQENVIIDDFDKTHAWQGYHLKIWADKYAFQAEVKGGAHYVRPKKICVTSNWSPSEIWGDTPQVLEPLLQRFHVVHFKRLTTLEDIEPVEEIRNAFVPSIPVDNLTPDEIDTQEQINQWFI